MEDSLGDRSARSEYTFACPEEKSETVAFTEESFMKAVECIQEYIGAGDVFQVNLSTRQERTLQTHPLEIYTSLREINPSPYMGYLELGDFQIVSIARVAN